MKSSSANILRALIVFVGIAALAFLLWEPHVEGRNINATFFEAYNDPFLAYAYIASIPFFVVLAQTFKVLGSTINSETIKSLRTIQYCAIAMIALVIGGVTMLLLGESDDRPPIIMMGNIMILGSVFIAWMAGKYKKIAERTMQTKNGA